MLAGKLTNRSPIAMAISEIQSQTSAQFHFHLSTRRFEKDPLVRAKRILSLIEAESASSAQIPQILIYLNFRKRTLSIVGSLVVTQKMGENFYSEVCAFFRKDLLNTQFENATALTVRTLATLLRRAFPPRPTSTK